VSSRGDIYIADTLNHRVRMVDHLAGQIHTVAGSGEPAESGPIGDGGPAVAAHLYMPSDVTTTPNGDLYIADMHHNRVRKVDAATRVISTVAGTGAFGNAGNGGPATAASLAGPAGLAIAPQPGGGVMIFVADYYNGLVRVIGPDGRIRNVSDKSRVAFGAPSRIAFRDGWLYVSDASQDRVVAFVLRNDSAPRLVAPPLSRRARDAG